VFRHPALPYPHPPPPHLVFCVHARPRRQKQLHHRRVTFVSSEMQRRPFILRRATALRQAPPLSTARVRVPPPATATPYVFTTPPAGRNRGRAHERSRLSKMRTGLISASNTLQTSGQAFRLHTPERRHCKPPLFTVAYLPLQGHSINGSNYNPPNKAPYKVSPRR